MDMYWTRGEPDSHKFTPTGEWAVEVIRKDPMTWIRTSFEEPIMCRLIPETVAVCFVRDRKGCLCPLSEQGYSKYIKALEGCSNGLLVDVSNASTVRIALKEAQEEYLAQRPIDMKRTRQIFLATLKNKK